MTFPIHHVSLCLDLLIQAIWDSLLDARIRLQKSITAANRLPAVSLYFQLLFYLPFNLSIAMRFFTDRSVARMPRILGQDA